MLWRSSVRNTAGGPVLSFILSLVYLLTSRFIEAPSTLILFRLTIFSLGWLLRGRLDPTRNQDLGLLAFLFLWKSSESVHLDRSYLTSFWRWSLSLPASGALLAVAGAGLIFYYALPTSRYEKYGSPCPLILPSRTTHTRFFPKHHSFSYSYLQVSIPVEFEGRCGSLISVGEASKRGWFHVQSSDYLDRTSAQRSLKEKLSTYLQSQGISNGEWDHAFLITAPRFLGYSFNPVSFWYIYTNDSKLSMMILEVNNTFDERRMYLLRSDDAGSIKDEAQKPAKEVSKRFKHVWAKDFHVSPFSSRKGHYSLSAVDPFGIKSSKPMVFDNTIILNSSKDHAKLVARVFSDGLPVEPEKASVLQTIQILMGWCWVGFLTSPRILKEAFVLYFKRNLHVWLRPEVLPSSVGRRATTIERSLESFFESYLADLVARSSRDLEVVYKSGLDAATTKTFYSGVTEKTTEIERLELRVLSPVFFSRFIHYAHTDEAFDRECIFTDEKNRTIDVSRPELLPLLFAADKRPNSKTEVAFVDRARWNIHQRLRCSPASPTYLFPDTGVTVQDIRSFSVSPFDRFVQFNNVDVSLYRRQCARLFLAQRFAFGFTELIDLMDLIIRVAFIFLVISAITPTRSHDRVESKPSTVDAVKILMRINSVHTWAYLKGIPLA